MKLLKQPLKKQSYTTTLNALSTQTSKSEAVGQTLTSPSRIGDIAEHYAITWLWDEGFEVFYNAGSTGAMDMIGIKDGEVYLFDVKTVSKNSHQVSRTDLQKKLGVQFIKFNPFTRKLSLVEHRAM